MVHRQSRRRVELICGEENLFFTPLFDVFLQQGDVIRVLFFAVLQRAQRAARRVRALLRTRETRGRRRNSSVL